MIGFRQLKYDYKLALREPIMVVFAILPLFIMILFRYVLPPAGDLLLLKTGFDISKYNTYVFAMTAIMTPYMTGTLAGFLMLDEKDGNILELVLVTPAGFSGYLLSRLIIPVVLTTLYILPVSIIFHSYYSGIWIIPGITVLLIEQALIIALLLYSIAKDKVSGLTIAKGLGLLMIPVFADLIGNGFISLISYITPFYWTYEFINNSNLQSLIMGVIVNSLWLVGLLLLGYLRTFKINRIIPHN